MLHRHYFAGLCLVALGTLVACKQQGTLSDTIPVSGKVTFKGQPVGGAIVSFAPKSQGGRAASGQTDASGVYKLTTLKAGDGALAGNYAVTVTKVAGTVTATGEPADPAAAMEAAYKAHAAGKDQKKEEPKDELPAKYKSAETSGLTAEVAKGKTTFDFDLVE